MSLRLAAAKHRKLSVDSSQMDATRADPLVGHLLDGRYRVGSRIARGGMATVYLATDTRLDRTVALKIMHRELATDADFVGRFIGEAKSVARLSHPNVVGVFDQGNDGEHLYLAMEYVPGRTLRDLLNERGRLGPDEALDLMVPVLAGLGAAHQVGFVHRDVKPENVLITADGRVKVVDFGLACAVAEARQTKTGMVIGTAAYLAPEQVSRACADARSDVYAVGVMLFELVTGRQPYTGDTPLAVAYKHVNDTLPAPSTLVPGLATAVDALVALATSRDAELRPGDASQLLRAVCHTRRQLAVGSAFAPAAEIPFHGWPEQQVPPGPPGQQLAGAAPYGAGSPPLAGPPARVSAGPPVGVPAGVSPGPPAGVSPGPFAGPPVGVPAGVSPGPLAGPLVGVPAGVSPAPPAGPPVGAPAGGSPLPGPPNAGPHGPQESVIFGVPGVPGVSALPVFAADPRGGGTGAFADAPRPSGYRTGFSAGTAGQNNTLIVSRGNGGPEPRPGRSLGDWLFSRRAAYLAGGLAVVLVVSLLVWWQVSGRYTRVPDVAGLTTPAAAAELRNLGFKVKMGTPRADNEVPRGDISGTLPRSGSDTLGGAIITVIPSAGPRMISVPNVTGQSVADAQRALTAAGLVPGATWPQTSPTIPQGEVISSDPPAGTSWPQTRPVKLTVSAGIGLPDFTGQPKQVAEQWLRQHQLQVQEQATNSTSQPQDNVIKQSPVANTPISQGEVITLYLSNGPPLVQIPSVTGMSVHHARRQLEALGFQVRILGFRHGTVIVYNPTGHAPKGSTITLFAGFDSFDG